MFLKKIIILIILLPILIYSSDKIIFGDTVEVLTDHPFLATNLFKIIKLNEKVISRIDSENNHSIPGGNKKNFSACMDIFAKNNKDTKDLNQIAQLYVLYSAVPCPQDVNETNYEFTEDEETLFDDFNKEKNDISNELLNIFKKVPEKKLLIYINLLFFRTITIF